MSKIQEQAKQAYSKNGNEYDEVRLVDPRGLLLSEHDRQIFDELFKPEGSGVNIVEIGAGTGRFTTVMLEQGHTLMATDINEAMLSVLREKIEAKGFTDKCTVQIDDIFNLSFADGQFDYGVCLHVVPRFLGLEEQRKAILQLGRVIKKDGLLLFNYRNKSSLLGCFFKGFAPSTKQIHAVLDEAGLEIVQQCGKHFLARKILNVTPLFIGRMVAVIDRMLWRFSSPKAWDIFVVARKK